LLLWLIETKVFQITLLLKADKRCVSCQATPFLKLTSYMTKLLTAFFLSLALVSCGQKKQNTDKDKERIDKVCDQFMQTFADGKIQEALQLFKQNTVMSPATIDTLQVSINDQFDKIFSAYGKMLSYEFVTERKIKDFIAKRFFILKFDKYYLKFDFTLYNNGKGWTITSFNYNEDLIEILY
jgi:hypothetical protein